VRVLVIRAAQAHVAQSGMLDAVLGLQGRCHGGTRAETEDSDEPFQEPIQKLA